ncbi:MAG: bifunctional pyr operon transcriptional regulator/uracil phosphoribosyltransferase PyrR [Betaproteobacteria bacterium]|nr:bifunctional pyr operon transcriptional regulator/uracil phosphoribosyltransferase PyrR [Betaproteobacteria bacterium]
MRLPDPEALLARLADSMRPEVASDTGLIGIHTGGVWVAERLHDMLGLETPLGTIDVAFYRDDYGQRGLKPEVQPSAIPFDVSGHDVIIVDDVLYTGRTVRAALNVLFDYGRPGRVRLAALVDRGGRQLPICAQFVGGAVDLGEERRVVSLARADDGTLALAMKEPRGAA